MHTRTEGKTNWLTDVAFVCFRFRCQMVIFVREGFHEWIRVRMPNRAEGIRFIIQVRMFAFGCQTEPRAFASLFKFVWAKFRNASVRKTKSISTDFNPVSMVSGLQPGRRRFLLVGYLMTLSRKFRFPAGAKLFLTTASRKALELTRPPRTTSIWALRSDTYFNELKRMNQQQETRPGQGLETIQHIAELFCINRNFNFTFTIISIILN
jgi:hypothetical protein